MKKTILITGGGRGIGSGIVVVEEVLIERTHCCSGGKWRVRQIHADARHLVKLKLVNVTSGRPFVRYVRGNIG